MVIGFLCIIELKLILRAITKRDFERKINVTIMMNKMKFNNKYNW